MTELSYAVLDANTTLNDWDAYREVTSVVGQWLLYEIERAGVRLAPVASADVVLLVHSGELDWRANCLDALRAHDIDPDPARRDGRPYLVTGGGIDTAPLTALSIADALAVGEAYRFVREMFKHRTVQQLRDWVVAYPHAIERVQVRALRRDADAPWLLADVPQPLATPDTWADWGDTPDFASDDGVTRIVASKGCHLKCLFCATTYRQTYRVRDDADAVRERLLAARSRGERVSLITNDAAALPFYSDIVRAGQLQFQSMTVKALRDPHVLDALTSRRMKIVRFGVEGLSERLRQSFGKPVSDDELRGILMRLWQARQQVHLFYIVGAPWEAANDWVAFEGFFNDLARRDDSYLTRVKMTAFNPQSPTPLAYFVPPDHYYARAKRFYDRRPTNLHFKFIPPRSPARRANDLADTYSIPREIATRLMRSDTTRDLAPTLDHARRAPWELIGWPLDVERRWRLSRSYMKRMGVDSAQGA